MIDQYLDRGIKEVIDRFPRVGRVLDEYQVGCTTCGVGTCKLKDVVRIHNLSADQEKALFVRLEAVLGGQADPQTASAVPAAKAPAAKPAFKYSPPLKKLVDEHTVIKRLLALVPTVAARLDLGREADRRAVRGAIAFIREYADKYHHAKEEDVLFKYFDESSDILQAMHADHAQARRHTAAMAEGLAAGDRGKTAAAMTAHRALLDEHIMKEDTILYPWMDRNLTTSQVGELYARFAEIDKEFGDAPRRHEEFVKQMEVEYGKESAV